LNTGKERALSGWPLGLLTPASPRRLLRKTAQLPISARQVTGWYSLAMIFFRRRPVHDQKGLGSTTRLTQGVERQLL
jgi:hypothetical protein